MHPGLTSNKFRACGKSLQKILKLLEKQKFFKPAEETRKDGDSRRPDYVSPTMVTPTWVIKSLQEHRKKFFLKKTIAKGLFEYMIRHCLGLKFLCH